MRPSDDIENMFTETHIETNTDVDKVVLDDAVRAMSKSKQKTPVFKRSDVWGIIMKGRITKLAVAAGIIMIVVLSVTVMDKSIPSAYALEQTMEAYEGLRFVHIKDFKEGQSESREFWVELDEQEQVKRFRAFLPVWAVEFNVKESMVMVWNEGKLQIWSKNDNVIMTKQADSPTLASELLIMFKECDPRSVVKELQQLEAEGKVEIKISEPELQSEPIVIAAKPLSQSNGVDQMVLYVDQNTKLVTRVIFNGTQQSREFLEYNVAIDERFFTFDDVPENVTRLNAAGYKPDLTETAATFMKTINAKLASLDINKSTADDVIAILGEPWAYRSRHKDLDEDNLPEVYTMDYPGGFMVSIHKNRVMLWGCQPIPGPEIPGYIFSDAIQIGSTLDDVFKKLGSPTKVVEGFGGEDNKIMYEDNTSYANMNINERKGFCFSRYDNNGKEIKVYFEDNVLYKDLGKIEGLCLYGTVSNGRRVRILSSDNKVVSLYEYRTEPIGIRE